MPWPATNRYGLAPAPGGLALAQDLLNTASAAGKPDLLADAANGRRWLSDAAAEWSAVTGQPAPEMVLTAADLQELRAFRDDVREAITRTSDAGPDSGTALPALHTGDAALQLGADGSVRLHPRQAGRRALVTLVLAVLFEAQQTDTRRRLKICRNPRCQTAFYDRSRNNSGVWHSVRTCGNTTNLRAYRERQRAHQQS